MSHVTISAPKGVRSVKSTRDGADPMIWVRNTTRRLARDRKAATPVPERASTAAVALLTIVRASRSRDRRSPVERRIGTGGGRLMRTMASASLARCTPQAKATRVTMASACSSTGAPSSLLGPPAPSSASLAAETASRESAHSAKRSRSPSWRRWPVFVPRSVNSDLVVAAGDPTPRPWFVPVVGVAALGRINEPRAERATARSPEKARESP
mmetsp:Transcript_23198/g.67689  ORF Transcript_23198/g.67689 Transcript_23198/m.67689 type:complete len:212 (-) Transcript_23198:915-1550(-)